jgi:hypothetical protein
MKRSVVVAALGTAQTLAWGSSYYLPAILADPIAAGLGLSRTVVFGIFSPVHFWFPPFSALQSVASSISMAVEACLRSRTLFLRRG